LNLSNQVFKLQITFFCRLLPYVLSEPMVKEAGAMTDNEIMLGILEALYKAKRRGDGPLSIDEIIKDWGEERDRVIKIADFMRQKKDRWVKFVSSGPMLEITDEGIEEYERRHKGKENI